LIRYIRLQPAELKLIIIISPGRQNKLICHSRMALSGVLAIQFWATHHFNAFSGCDFFCAREGFFTATTMQLARRAPSGSGVEGWLVTGGVWRHRCPPDRCTLYRPQHSARCCSKTKRVSFERFKAGARIKFRLRLDTHLHKSAAFSVICQNF
jgi:hypothetical protein